VSVIEYKGSRKVILNEDPGFYLIDQFKGADCERLCLQTLCQVQPKFWVLNNYRKGTSIIQFDKVTQY
jgi:hypothetical protein